MSLRYICGISSNVQITLPLSFANLLDSNDCSPIKTAGETSTQTSRETQTQIAVKRGTLTLEEIQIQPAEEWQSQMVDESEIFVSGNTHISSTNETRTLTVEGTEPQVVAETQIPSAEETRTRAVEAIQIRGTGMSKIRSVEKTQTRATTESTNLARDETQIQPPEETYPRTKTAEYMSTLATEEAKNAEENESSILNGKDICYLSLLRNITIIIVFVINVKGIVFPSFFTAPLNNTRILFKERLITSIR